MKVLLVVDSYNWALYNRAISLQYYIKDHDFLIKSFKDVDNIDFNKFDIVYILNWPIHGYIPNKINKKQRRRYRLITSVSSHINRPHASRLNGIFKYYDAISCSNISLYEEFKPHYNNVFYTPFGVDTITFTPKTNPSDYKNIVGWVGNKNRAVKRFSEIKEAVTSIPNIEFKYVDESYGYSRAKMADYYNSIGCLVCFSESEGTPNPILEAAACGRPIISTLVGNVSKLLESTKGIYIVNTKEEIIETIGNIRNYDMHAVGMENRNAISHDWSWGRQYLNFIQFLGVKHTAMADINKIIWFWNVNDAETAKYNRVTSSKSEAVWGEKSISSIIETDIISHVGDLKGKKVLDFGCGVGRILKYTAKYSDNCHGVDIAPNMLKFAKEYIDNPNVVLRQSNGKQLPYSEGEFDVIYSFHVLQHIPTREMLVDTLKEIKRVLRKNGKAVLHFTHKVSEFDRDAGQFAGYRPTPENAEKLIKEAGFTLIKTNIKADKHFLLYLTKA